METVSIFINILSAIALFFVIFAMGAIILLARRVAILTDDFRSLLDTIKEKISITTDKITETAEEARQILSDVKKVSGLLGNLQTFVFSSRKFAYYMGIFLAGLKTGLKLFMKAKQKRKKEADKNGGK